MRHPCRARAVAVAVLAPAGTSAAVPAARAQGQPIAWRSFDETDGGHRATDAASCVSDTAEHFTARVTTGVVRLLIAATEPVSVQIVPSVASISAGAGSR